MLEAWATDLTWQQQLVLILASPAALFLVIYSLLTAFGKDPFNDNDDLSDRES